MTFTAYDLSTIKRPNALQAGTGLFTFKMLERAGKPGWTNGHLVDLSLPNYIRAQVEKSMPGAARRPTLNSLSLELLLEHHQKDDGRLYWDAIELIPQAFGGQSAASAGQSFERVYLADPHFQVACSMNRCYFSYLVKVHKGLKFYSRDSHVDRFGGTGSAIAAAVDGKVVGVIEAFGTDPGALKRWVQQQEAPRS